MKEKVCPDCGWPVSMKGRPAENPLLAHLECMNGGCKIGPIYMVDVSEATRGLDAAPVLRAMRDLSAVIESDAETMQEMMDMLRGLS